MNILWIINIPLPEVSQLMKEKPVPFGGWLVNTSISLSEQNNIRRSVTFPKNGINEIKILKGQKINYYVFPTISENDVIHNNYLL